MTTIKVAGPPLDPWRGIPLDAAVTYFTEPQELARRLGNLRALDCVRSSALRRLTDSERREMVSLQRALAQDLVHRLRTGDLIGRGFTVGNVLPVTVPEEFWTTVELDMDASAVTGHGITFTGVLISWRPNAPAEASDCKVAPGQKSRNSGGRPGKFDWEAFAAELVRLANTPDGLPNEQALRQHMLAWCAANFSEEPADSTFRDKLAKLTAGLRAPKT